MSLNLIDEFLNESWTNKHLKITILLGLGLFFEYYDIFVAGYIAPSLLASEIFNNNLHGFMNLTDIALFTASMFTGMWLGTLFFGFISDKYGRRTIFTWSLIWYSVCTLIMAFQETKSGFNYWRFLASIGIGVEMVTITTYLTELIPAKYRGRATSIAMIIAFTAVPVVAFLSWCLSNKQIYGFDGYRVVIAAGSLGAFFVWFIRRNLPESPRWLLSHGQYDEAVNALKVIFPGLKSEKVMEAITMEKMYQLPNKYIFKDIFRKPYLKITITLMIFHVLQTIGYYGFATWGPILLLAKGITVTKTLKYSFFIALANPIAPLIHSFFADRIERKWQIILASLAIAIFGMAFATQSNDYLIVTCGILLTLSINFLSCAFLLYQTEIYPTTIRSSSSGFVYSWSRLSAIFSSFIITLIIQSFGVVWMFTFIASCMFMIMAIIYFNGIKTTNIRLENIHK